MARPRKPFLHQGWFYSKINGVRTKLVPVADGEVAATKKLDELVKASDKAKSQMRLAEDSPVTVFEAAGLFMQAKEGEGLDDGTLVMYKQQLSSLVDAIGNTAVARVTLKHGEEYRKKLIDADYGPTTIDHRLRCAKSLFIYCINHSYIDKNPWRELKAPKARVRNRTVSDDEFESLLGEVRKNRLVKIVERNVCVLKLLRYTGLRPGELRILTWDMIRWDKNLIIIPPSKHKTGKTTKEPKPRMIPILDEAIEVLRFMQEKGASSTHVFESLKGNKLTQRGLSGWFHKLVTRAGLDGEHASGERLVMYHLRHTRLTEAAVEENWSLFNLMEMAGHTNPATTKRYVHTQGEDLVRAAKEGQARRRLRDDPPNSDA